MQDLAVWVGAVSVPGSDVPRQDALDGAGVEIPQYLRGYLEFPQVSEVNRLCLAFLTTVSVCSTKVRPSVR